MKEKLYIGEATVATIAGLILGPHCLGWFDPLTWGNTDEITLEICRIVLCIQIVAVAVELPRKYMKKHWLSVAILLLPVMTCGWLVVGLFVWILIPHFDFPDALLVSACVTATDPVLAAAVVGKGKFAERVPGHLRNLLTAESGCNDGMAFPFIYLSLGLITYKGHPGEIIKDWITLTILWECFFGTLLGVILGYTLRKAVTFAETKKLIDRESFLAIFVFLAFNCAGIGSMLGVDDLLVSFAAGTAFGWNGAFARKTEESHVSTVIDLLLNLAFFVYFGSIVPWADFNNAALGLNVWRLVVLAVVVIFLRRIPAVLALKPFTPDIKSWREAFFCGHFGPIGVGAIFASILARKDLEDHYTTEHTPLEVLDPSMSHYQLIYAIWPIVCFIVVTSIIVHGSSVAVLTLGKRLNRMAITMSFTVTNTQDQGPSWMSRLQKLEKTSTSYSLHRIDTKTNEDDDSVPNMPRTNTVETSGVKVRPAGGARRKGFKKKSRHQKPQSPQELDLGAGPAERQRPETAVLQLGRVSLSRREVGSSPESTTVTGSDESKNLDLQFNVPEENLENIKRKVSKKLGDMDERTSIEATVYQEGLRVIIEDNQGEIIDTVSLDQPPKRKSTDSRLDVSIHSMESLRRNMSQFSVLSDPSLGNEDQMESLGERLSRTLSGPGRKAIVRKSNKKKYFAHRVDKLIVIENEDGEIVRRYRVNRHPDKNKTRSRSSSLVNKALSLVGINTKDSQPSGSPAQALPKPGLEPVAEDDGQLLSPKISNRPAKKSPPIHRSPSIASEELEHLFDPTDSDETESLPDETEVEKRRRLAALGEIAGERGESDEED